MQERQSNSFLPFIFSIVLILGMFLGFKLARTIPSTQAVASHTPIEDIIQLIEREYVDSIDAQTLYAQGIQGVLQNLDPHTVYIPATELTQSNEQLAGAFYGIGIEFFITHDTVCIARIMPDGPSAHSGIRPGDQLLLINDSLVAGQSFSDEEIIAKIKGQNKQRIKLGILHPNKKFDTIQIERGKVPLHSVSAYYNINDTTVYIAINVFSEHTYSEFKKALQSFSAEQKKHVIIDVRDNPGGYMEAVAQIADEFIPAGYTLIKTKSRFSTDSIVSKKNGLFEQGRVSVLINEYSASASEILAGIIQDVDRGQIIGRRSFGKGLVQEQFDLPDRSAIRITVARYYLPSGRCIQKSYQQGKPAYEQDIENRYQQGELYQAVQQNGLPHDTFLTLKKHRRVWGATGIQPDIFVPLDSVAYVHKLVHFYTQQLAAYFATRYVALHPTVLQSYTSLQKFAQTFRINASMEYDLLQLLIANGIPANVWNQPYLQQIISRAIMTELADQLVVPYGKSYMKALNDPLIQKALP